MAAKKVLTADEILKAKDFKIEPVDVPEWDGQVFVRTFSAKGREEFDRSLIGDEENEEGEEAKLNTDNIRARVIALTCCDDKGKLLFTFEQAEQLAEKCDDAIRRIYEVAAKMNKIRRKDVDAEKKESETPPAGESGTA